MEQLSSTHFSWDKKIVSTIILKLATHSTHSKTIVNADLQFWAPQGHILKVILLQCLFLMSTWLIPK